MTLDELLVDLKQHNGNDWPRMALHMLLITHGQQALGQYNDALYVPLRALIEKFVSAGVAATWHPAPEVWAEVPSNMLWMAGRNDGLLDAFEDEPSLFPDQWWSRAGNVWHVGAELPLGVDWRTAKWKRPEVQP